MYLSPPVGSLDHLWLHFTEMGRYRDGEELQVIVRGDGCYLEDAAGRRYLDALAGLFCVNIGYGFGDEMGEAAAAQMRELPFAINWTYAHPRSIELAGEIASLTPGDLNRVFFVWGGSEAVEAAWKLARQHYGARGERRWKAIARRLAYHGTTMGALSINGCTELRTPFEPLVPDVLHVSNTNRYHRPRGETEEQFTSFLLDELEATIRQAGPETVAMVILEPVQNTGGSFMPPAGYLEGVRESEDDFRAALEPLLDLPIVGDLRGTGFFYALELVKDKESRATFTHAECDDLLRRFVSPRLFEEGLICRADDRGDPVVQISPPLVAGQEQFEEIAQKLGTVLGEAGERMQVAA
jgi:adenosylmethionine-8-amino-7-oxononanoate aminotransferase